jgi:hypothetical protein
MRARVLEKRIPFEPFHKASASSKFKNDLSALVGLTRKHFMCDHGLFQ